MKATFFAILITIKVLIVASSIVFIIINLIRAASKNDLNGYSKALKIALSLFAVLLLITVLEFCISTYLYKN
ncbi:hypothetical protein Slin_2723 [Spirosoma linguale DSM 74]|uniref:Uncharacterized protein n=1 Tax=Spirosoma linguale (strain ATCC 33905 / DSM 74 / LMG 10896 / Claus 1) TaxID=504472 RepID=D2QIF5_SPILD|nr:hypothetical protein Slin_2723 [Spirosoma linguale DSM 74]